MNQTPKFDALPLLLFLAVITTIVVYGCSQIQPIPKRSFPPALQALRTKALSGSGGMPKAAPAPAPKASVTLAWNNYDAGNGWTETGVEVSTNTTDWIVATNVPWRAGEIKITLSNRPPWEFYRAFNRKPLIVNTKNQ